jgi:2-keto-4-pentenoate hydratase
MTGIDKAADFLYSNRINQQVVDNIPESIYPVTEDQAYQVQTLLVEKLTKHYHSEGCGYKIACTNSLPMELLGVKEPFSGRMLSHSTHQNGITLKAGNFVRRVVELEFAFVMGQDVPPSEMPYTALTILPFISGFIPGIEIVDHRFTDYTGVGGNALIADNAIHGASILANPVTDWKSVKLSQHPVNLMVNGKSFSRGSGQNVLGDPMNVVAWLANHLLSRELTLNAGDLVTTGTACDIYEAVAGDSIRADFGQLGSVSMSFE